MCGPYMIQLILAGESLEMAEKDLQEMREITEGMLPSDIVKESGWSTEGWCAPGSSELGVAER